MYCPKCGAEGNGGQNYCRRCGVNLALVGKAVTVSEVIARGDSGLLPKIKSAMGNLKLDEVSEQVAKHVESIGVEVERSVREKKQEALQAHESLRKQWRRTPEEQRAHLFGKGFGAMFGGIAMMIVLYVVGHRVPFNFPPELLAKVPFDLYAMINLVWLFGLIPGLSGLGQVIGAFMIRRTPAAPHAEIAPDMATAVRTETSTSPLLDATTAEEFHEPPSSVTEDTTAQLDYDRVAANPDRRSSRA